VALTGLQYRLTAGAHEATIAEVGAGLREYRFDGVDVTVPYGEAFLPPKGNGGVLVPWPNRLRGGEYTFGGRKFQLPLTEPANRNAIHGLARWTRWTPLAIEPSWVTLAVDLVPQTGWIFEVRVEVTYALHAETGLSVTTVARNTGGWPAPFGIGFHPYFSTHGAKLADVTVELPAEQRIIMDAAQLPVGDQHVGGTAYDLRRGRKLHTLRLDDAFTGLTSGVAEVRSHNGGAAIWFDESFRYAQVFTVEELTPGVPGVAIEPMTCPPDAFNSGESLIVLEPGASWTGTWGARPLASGHRTVR
jgi:aldose 1-epimerase